LAYLKDAERTLNYYRDETADGLAFERTWGRLAPQLGVDKGITESQWQGLFNAHWDGEKIAKTGYRKVVDPNPSPEALEAVRKAGEKHVYLKDPETGKDVTETGIRTPGVDIVFATPKGVSQAYALAKTQEQADAIAAAVLASVELAWTKGVQDHARIARVPGPPTSSGRPTQERVLADLLCTPALQFTARPTPETDERNAPADPHLHVHCFTFTAAQVDGRWLTIDEAGIKRTAEYRDQIFMGELARQMMDLGYDLDFADFDSSRSGRVTFEPKNIDKALNAFWSSNHERKFALIEQFEKKYHRPPKDMELTWLMKASRGKKADKVMDSNPARHKWVEDAQEAGFAASPMSPRPFRRIHRDPLRELRRRLLSPKGLCREEATFSGDKIGPAVVRCAVGLGLTWEKIEAFQRTVREELVLLRPAIEDRFALYTTTVQLAKEAFITKRRGELSRPMFRPIPAAAVADAIARQSVDLDSEQRQAVEAACSSSGWVHIAGEAGSGKSTTAKAIVAAHRKANPRTIVVAVSVAAKTANDFGQKIEADRWGSVESILKQIKTGNIAPTNNVIWMIDEAAMMDTHRMAELLRVTRNGRIVMMGDHAQITPIGAAGWYGESLEDHGAAQLTRVHRQRDDKDINDYKAIRNSRASEAVKSLDERGRIHVSEDKSERLTAVMADYQALRERGLRADQIRQIIETSNHEVDTMNRFVQRDRIARGEVTGPGFTVEDQEQSRRWTLHAGDQVIFLRSHHERGQIPIRNGTTATVLEINDVGVARLALPDRTAVVWLEESAYAQPLGLAYAQHDQKMQGAEVEHVQVLPGDPTTATANKAYSQLTRAIGEAHVYVDREAFSDQPVEVLGLAWEQRDEKFTAQSVLARRRAQQQEPVIQVQPVQAREFAPSFGPSW
jgi:ABC-type dipeptide/oligopeptide/nickel transport system ATPase subunit